MAAIQAPCLNWLCYGTCPGCPLNHYLQPGSSLEQYGLIDIRRRKTATLATYNCNDVRQYLIGKMYPLDPMELPSTAETFTRNIKVIMKKNEEEMDKANFVAHDPRYQELNRELDQIVTTNESNSNDKALMESTISLKDVQSERNVNLNLNLNENDKIEEKKDKMELTKQNDDLNREYSRGVLGRLNIGVPFENTTLILYDPGAIPDIVPLKHALENRFLMLGTTSLRGALNSRRAPLFVGSYSYFLDSGEERMIYSDYLIGVPGMEHMIMGRCTQQCLFFWRNIENLHSKLVLKHDINECIDKSKNKVSKYLTHTISLPKVHPTSAEFDAHVSATISNLINKNGDFYRIHSIDSGGFDLDERFYDTRKATIISDKIDAIDSTVDLTFAEKYERIDTMLRSEMKCEPFTFYNKAESSVSNGQDGDEGARNHPKQTKRQQNDDSNVNNKKQITQKNMEKRNVFSSVGSTNE